MKVRGHFVIENEDPKGGITLKSAGYTNLLTAAERIDVTGNPGVALPVFDPTPLGRATYTHLIHPYTGPTPRGLPGSVYIENGPGPYKQIVGGVLSTVVGGARLATVAGVDKTTVKGVKTTNVTGPKIFNVAAFIVNGSMTFLN